MDWSQTRGSSVKNPTDNKTDDKIPNMRVIYIVNKKLEKYHKKYNIKNNKYAKWQII